MYLRRNLADPPLPPTHILPIFFPMMHQANRFLSIFLIATALILPLAASILLSPDAAPPGSSFLRRPYIPPVYKPGRSPRISRWPGTRPNPAQCASLLPHSPISSNREPWWAGGVMNGFHGGCVLLYKIIPIRLCFFFNHVFGAKDALSF